MSKSKNGGLDQYGAEPFEQQQFGTAGVERVKTSIPVKMRIGFRAESQELIAVHVDGDGQQQLTSRVMAQVGWIGLRAGGQIYIHQKN